MKTVTVKLESGEIQINKLPLGKYPELFESLGTLPKHFNGLSGATTEEMLAQVPQIVSKALPDAINAVSVATEIEVKEINQWGLDELTEVVLAVIEVNNFKSVYNNLKKAIARPSQPEIV